MLEDTPLIEFKNVSKRFGQKTVLSHVNLSLFEGQVTTIIGKSGVGKSVLIKHIIGLLQPDSGDILYRGKSLLRLKKQERKTFKQAVSYMFQHNALFDSMTVFENIALPLREKTDLSDEDIESKVLQRISALDLAEVAYKYPSELSGGMQKRTALARALITDPKIVLFDEPTTGLDPIRKNAVLTMIARNHRNFGFTAILVSHDIPDVFYISDRIALIEEGSIVFEGSPFDIKQSEHPVVRMFSRNLTELKDSLTDLQTRKDIEDHYQRALTEGTFGDQPLMALLFTIKNLKQEDSRRSHLITQRIIQSFSQFLDSNLESIAWSGRCGPDQILAILPRTDWEKAQRFLNTLSKDMKELPIFKAICRPSDHIFFSVGVMMIQGRPGMDFKTLIQTGWSDEQELAQLQCGVAEGLQ